MMRTVVPAEDAIRGGLAASGVARFPHPEKPQ